MYIANNDSFLLGVVDYFTDIAVMITAFLIYVLILAERNALYFLSPH